MKIQSRLVVKAIPTRRGFSLIELLTSISILMIMMAAAATMLTNTQRVWISSWTRTAQFRDARLAFELISRNLSQSTLNTYWDYIKDNNGALVDYGRKSELHFYNDKAGEILNENISPTHAVFFQAVLGYSRDETYQQLNTLLNGRGYFIEFGDDDFQKPNFLDTIDNPPLPRYRYRLMEYMPPTEKNLVYHADISVTDDSNPEGMKTWFSPDLIKTYSRPVVDNVIALIISPHTSPESDSEADANRVYDIAPNYKYDSRDNSKADSYNVLPPLVDITLIALDELAAINLQQQYGETPPPLINSEYFKVARDYEDDLEAVEKELQDKGINYRIFSTTVSIKAAKWSL